jgi:hypothetical protein
MKARYLVAVVLLAAGCSSLHPVAVQIGDRCYRCRRSIGETKLAAELIDQQGAPFPFRTTGCLSKYLKSHPGDKGSPFVTDYNTGRLFDASSAWFVPTELQPTDSRAAESDYIAFASQTEAEAANAKHATLLRWNQVVAAAVD